MLGSPGGGLVLALSAQSGLLPASCWASSWPPPRCSPASGPTLPSSAVRLHRGAPTRPCTIGVSGAPGGRCWEGPLGARPLGTSPGLGRGPPAEPGWGSGRGPGREPRLGSQLQWTEPGVMLLPESATHTGRLGDSVALSGGIAPWPWRVAPAERGPAPDEALGSSQGQGCAPGPWPQGRAQETKGVGPRGLGAVPAPGLCPQPPLFNFRSEPQPPWSRKPGSGLIRLQSPLSHLSPRHGVAVGGFKDSLRGEQRAGGAGSGGGRVTLSLGARVGCTPLPDGGCSLFRAVEVQQAPRLLVYFEARLRALGTHPGPPNPPPLSPPPSPLCGDQPGRAPDPGCCSECHSHCEGGGGPHGWGESSMPPAPPHP